MNNYSPRAASFRAKVTGRLAKSLKKERENSGLSLRELASRVGTTYGSLANIEVGRSACPLWLLVALADEFDTTLDSLVSGEANSEVTP